MPTNQKTLTRLAMAVSLLCGLSGPALAAPPAFSVAIDSAVVQNNMQLSISGTLGSSEPGKSLPGINIELLPPVGAPVRLASNLVLEPSANGRFNWSGKLPTDASVTGAQIGICSHKSER